MAKILIGRVLAPGTDGVTATQGPPGLIAWPVRDMAKLVPKEFDQVLLGYTGANLTTVVYKLVTVTVATLTLAYTGARLDSVVRT